MRKLLLVAAVLVLAGCGRSGPERYQVSGTVSYRGAPVPAGEVIFEPDPSKGNVGPQSRAAIIDGKFETSADRGSVPGPVVVRIRACDGKADGESPVGQMLCPLYETTLELPREDHTCHLEIPDSHGFAR